MVTGHLWTVLPTLAHRAIPRRAPTSTAFTTAVEDARLGSVELTGRLRHHPTAQSCLVVIHGLGGTPDAFYCARAAWAAEAARMSCLRLALRGADGRGEDFYHAGLTPDLEAALSSRDLERYSTLYLLGYSLGGHVTLRTALKPRVARLRAVAAICPPLDLARGAGAIDQPRAAIYRRHVLTGLKQMYREVAARRAVPTSLRRALAAESIREWDALTVVPRYGFASVDDYYATQSVGPMLSTLDIPALIVHSAHDPMIPEWTYAQHLKPALPYVTRERLDSGGHVSFPARDAIEARVMAWLEAQA